MKHPSLQMMVNNGYKSKYKTVRVLSIRILKSNVVDEVPLLFASPVHRPFYILSCIQTLPTQCTTLTNGYIDKYKTNINHIILSIKLNSLRYCFRNKRLILCCFFFQSKIKIH